MRETRARRLPLKALLSAVLLAALVVIVSRLIYRPPTYITVQPSPPSGAVDELLSYYEYDRSIPLEAEVSRLSEEELIVVYKVYYTSVNNVRVPALLILPKVGRPPYPCIVFLHGYGGRKEGAIPLARVAAPLGFAVFSIDAVYHGERSVPGKQLYSPDLEESRKGFIQTVLDLRRGIDFLETVKEVDAERIGYAGGSMGGILGAIFIGVEPRVKAAVIVVGGGNMTLMIRESTHPAVPPIRERIEREKIDWKELERLFEPVEPLNFIWRFSPRPVQFHCGRYDTVVPAEAQRQLAERAGEPKEVYWYDSGHDVPLDKVVQRAMEFFIKHLKSE
ncbi:MAG: alpha/beta fold hydrolase [Thermofilum sp.]